MLPRAGCISLYGIATMHKPATHVGLRDSVERLSNRRDQRLDCPSLGAAQTRFALRPARLHGVKVWRRGRQSEAPCALPRQQFFLPGHFVGRQIIPQHDVAGLQSRTQDFAYPAVKNLAIAGAVTPPTKLQTFFPGSVSPG